MRKLLSVIVCLFAGLTMLMAQNRTVTGTVISNEAGEPIIGASIRVSGTAIGTTTDGNGKFSLSVPQDAKTLEISYVGMEPVTVPVRSKIRIVLKSDEQYLDEVMVVAYGTATKSSFTGSAVKMDAEKIDVRVVSDVTNALAGNVSGVTAVKSNGQPGTSATIRVRGFGSINANMDPLYVLDGMPYSGDISAIDPQDIEQISVLKDAAAASLYGARAANGVVMITTKKGRQNMDAKVTFEANWGSNSRQVKSFKTINNTNDYYSQLYRTSYNDAIYNLGYGPANARLCELLGTHRNRIPYLHCSCRRGPDDR